jgi:hypothetical protein
MPFFVKTRYRYQGLGKHNQALIRRNPEYQNLTNRVIDLYAEIIEKGVRNEKSRQQS